MTETHLAVVIDDTVNNFPMTKKGNPKVGHFPYQCCYDEDATKWVFQNKEGNAGAGCDADVNAVATLTEILYTIPLNEWETEDGLYIAAHAAVVKASDELVANGSFELPTVVKWTVFPTGHSGLKWTVEPTDGSWNAGEGLELQRIWTPNSELQYAELDAYEPVIIYQNLSTWPEGRCTLTYAWSPCPGISENKMEVWWDGSKIDDTHSADGSLNNNTVWTVETHSLVPNASDPTRLEFIEVGPSDSYGMFLDSVSVVCVQEETAWADGQDFDGKNWATYFTYNIELVVGHSYGGGKVAYILVNGDTGYDPSVQHGLIATEADATSKMSWSNIFSTEVGAAAQGQAIGTGQANTTAIVGQTGCTSGAAYYCYNLTEGGHSDWFLPSLDELDKLFDNKDEIGGFDDSLDSHYWSSSESDANAAWLQGFDNGNQWPNLKFRPHWVRAVRAF